MDIYSQYPLYWDLCKGTSCFQRSYEIENELNCDAIDVSIDLIEGIELFLQAIFAGGDIIEVGVKLGILVKLYWPVFFGDVEFIFCKISNEKIQLIQNIFTLPSSVGLFKENYKECKISKEMDTKVSAWLQSFYMVSNLTITKCAHRFLYLLQLDNMCEPACLYTIRELQRLRIEEDFKSCNLVKKTIYESTDWNLSPIIDEDINFAEKIPDFVWTLLVQLVLESTDIDIQLLKDVYNNQDGSKWKLYQILCPILPIRLLHQLIYDIFLGFSELVIAIWKMDPYAEMSDWCVIILKLCEKYVEVDQIKLFRLLFICIQARIFGNIGVNIIEIISIVSWYLCIDLSSADLDDVNPFSLTRVCYNDQFHECENKEFRFFLNAFDISTQLSMVQEKFGISSERFMKWFEDITLCLPSGILNCLKKQIEKDENAELVFASVFKKRRIDDPLPSTSQIYNRLESYGKKLDDILIFGPMISFYCPFKSHWIYYVPGMNLDSMFYIWFEGKKLYLAFFCGYLPMLIEDKACYFNLYTMNTFISCGNIMHWNEFEKIKKLQPDNVFFFETIGISSLCLNKNLLILCIETFMDIEQIFESDQISYSLNCLFSMYGQAIKKNIIQDTAMNLHQVLNMDEDMLMDSFFNALSQFTMNEDDKVKQALSKLYGHNIKTHTILKSLVSFVTKCNLTGNSDQRKEIFGLLEEATLHEQIFDDAMKYLC